MYRVIFLVSFAFFITQLEWLPLKPKPKVFYTASTERSTGTLRRFPLPKSAKFTLTLWKRSTFSKPLKRTNCKKFVTYWHKSHTKPAIQSSLKAIRATSFTSYLKESSLPTKAILNQFPSVLRKVTTLVKSHCWTTPRGRRQSRQLPNALLSIWLKTFLREL